ncbi:serine-rich adhesin for platelets isoform X8 [Octopus sinensis]|uniref:Serine-rich adhesin for platelets isoform X8 n=1 Tax=Octopus sinensis TaxID=2607531 RepID=A0A7E6FRY7_9MOLL|nr:serine-rich adhesin for platelets isoform X8 [Octopus sinensis]
MPKISISCRLHYGFYGNREGPHPARRVGSVSEGHSTVETARMATTAVSHFRGQTTTQDFGLTEERKVHIDAQKENMVSTLTVGCLANSRNGFNCNGLWKGTRRLSIKNCSKEPQKQESILIDSDNPEHIPQCNTDFSKSTEITDKGHHFTSSCTLAANSKCAILKTLSPVNHDDKISGNVSFNENPQMTRDCRSQETDIESEYLNELCHKKVSPQTCMELDRETYKCLREKNAPSVKADSDVIAQDKVIKGSSLFHPAKPQECNTAIKSDSLISNETQELKDGDCSMKKSEWSMELSSYPVETFIIRTNPVARNFCSMLKDTSSVLGSKCKETKMEDCQQTSLRESNIQTNIIKSSFATINLAPCQGAINNVNSSIKTISSKHTLEEPVSLKLAFADGTKTQTNFLNDNNSSSSNSSCSSEKHEAVSFGHQNGLQLQKNGETFPETSEESQELGVSELKRHQQWKEQCCSTEQERAPAVRVDLEDVTVKAGSSAVFEWKVDGFPQPSLLWKHNDVILTENELYKICYDGQSAILQLQESLAEDAGTYVCTATNRAGSCETKAELSVLGIPPTIVQSIETVTALRGSPARLQCCVTSDPEATVSWKFKGKEIHSDGRIQITQDSDLHYLDISHVMPEDDGCYEFTATNPLGNLTCTSYIIVKENQETFQEFQAIPKFTEGSKFSTSESREGIGTNDTSETCLPKYSSFSSSPTSNHTPATNVVLAKNYLSSRLQSLAGSSSATDPPNILFRSCNQRGLIQGIFGVPGICKGESKSNTENRMEKTVCCPQFGEPGEEMSQMRSFNSEDNVSRIFTNITGNFTTASEKFTSASEKYTSSSGNFTTVPGKSTTVPGRFTSVSENFTIASGKFTDTSSNFTTETLQPQIVFARQYRKEDTYSLRSESTVKSPHSDRLLKQFTASASKEKELAQGLRAAVEKKLKMTSYNNIDDEDQLEKMLEKVDNFEERKKIRARLREIRDKQMSSPKEGTEKSGDSTEVEANKNKDCSETSKSGEGDKENIDPQQEVTEKSGDSTEDDINKNKNCSETSKTGENDKENSDSPKEGTEKSGDSIEDDVNKNKDCSETSKSGESDKENIDSPQEVTEKSGNPTEDDVNKDKNSSENNKIAEGDKENIDSPKEGTEKSEDSTDDVNKNKDCSETSKSGEGDKENIDSPKEGTEKSEDSTDDVNKNKDCSETSKSGEGDKENIDECNESKTDSKQNQEEKTDTQTVVTKDGSGGMKECTETKTVSADGTTTTVTKMTKIVSGNPSMSSTIIAGGAGSQTTTTEVQTAADGTKTTVIKKTQTVTKTVAGPGAGGMAANAPKGGLAAPAKPVTRSPSAIKQMLLEWTKAMTQEYADKVVITNFSSSWANGLAFCALIHHFYPESFDFYALDPKKRRYNFDLAFQTAEKCADIAPLLDTDDMVKMQKPDWKCVFTYVQSFYRKLQKHERNKAMPKA